MQYIQAPAGWSCADKNPFTQDGSYGAAWSSFCLLDRADDQFCTGQNGDGPFSARFGRQVAHLELRLADFLRYEHAHHRTVILSFPEDMDGDTYVAQALSRTPAAHIVRPEDPPVIVHTTTLRAWESILSDGELKAASELAVRGQRTPDNSDAPSEIDQYLSNEPPEYKSYIMFGEMDSIAPEMVVASYQAGRFVLDEQAMYEPGVRLYFDNHRIIRDGLGTRDGLHLIKVHRRLPLQPYLLAAIRVVDLAPETKVAHWTLRAFVDRANEAFKNGLHPR